MVYAKPSHPRSSRQRSPFELLLTRPAPSTVLTSLTSIFGNVLRQDLSGQRGGEVLFAMTKITFKPVTFGLEDVVILVLDLPTAASGFNDVLDVIFGEAKYKKNKKNKRHSLLIKKSTAGRVSCQSRESSSWNRSNGRLSLLVDSLLL